MASLFQNLTICRIKDSECLTQPCHRVPSVSMLVTGGQNLALGHLKLGCGDIRRRVQSTRIKLLVPVKRLN